MFGSMVGDVLILQFVFCKNHRGKKTKNKKQKKKEKRERKEKKKKKKPVKTMTDNRVAVTLCGVGGK